MVISDIYAEAEVYGSRFVTWLKFLLPLEATLGANGQIVMENDRDGAGETFAGLTQRDDQLPANPMPEWVAATYRRNYWNAVSANYLPYGVAEETATIAVNEGVGTASKILQGILGVTQDGIIGLGTISAALKADPTVVCRQLAALNDQHYRAIVAAHPDDQRFLRGWLNRDAAMEQAFDTPPV